MWPAQKQLLLLSNYRSSSNDGIDLPDGNNLRRRRTKSSETPATPPAFSEKGPKESPSTDGKSKGMLDKKNKDFVFIDHDDYLDMYNEYSNLHLRDYRHLVVGHKLIFMNCETGFGISNLNPPQERFLYGKGDKPKLIYDKVLELGKYDVDAKLENILNKFMYEKNKTEYSVYYDQNWHEESPEKN